MISTLGTKVLLNVGSCYGNTPSKLLSTLFRKHLSSQLHNFRLLRTTPIQKTGIIIGLGSCLGISWYSYKHLRLFHPPQVLAIDAPPKKTRTQFDLADVVEKAAPAVVCIEVKGRHVASSGSGFIVRENGLIVTNAHVVHNSQVVKVRLHDGREFEGVVTTVERVMDLATIQIQATNLPTIPLGCSDQLRPGEWVLAMGSPLSLSNTVTAGIISSVHRESRELGIHNKNMQYIQTDAIINSGNSGGPLVNLNGEAIGINTMRVTPGISFAIPSNYVKHYLKKAEEAMKRAKNRSPERVRKVENRSRYIGIDMISLTESLVNELKAEGIFPKDVLKTGVFVRSVHLGSPAHMGGIQPGDVITHINGHGVQSHSDVLAAAKATDLLKVQVQRNSLRLLLTVQPTEAE